MISVSTSVAPRSARSLLSAATVLCVGLLVALCVQAPSVFAADWLYTVRPGDKLWTLAEKYCGSYTHWRDLAQHNELSQPTRLQAGTRLRIPLKLLVQEPSAVRVIYTRGDTQVLRADGTPAQSIALGDMLTIDDTLVTGSESYANIQFADGSTLQIGPSSELVFDTLSAYRDTGMVDSRVRLNRGSSSSEVNSQKGPGSVYRISTPLGVAAVRGTEFRTRSDGDASFVETTGGAVQFIAGTGSTDVSKGYGLKADPQGVTVEELLEAPALGAPQVYGSHQNLEWNSLSGAASYLVQVYSGPDLSELLAGAVVPTSEYELASLEPGAYVFGIRGIAASGLQGLEATQAVEVEASLSVPQNLLVKQPRKSRDLLVSWQPVDGAVDYQIVVTP